MMLRARLRNFARDTRNTWDYYGSKMGGFPDFRACGCWRLFFWFFSRGGGGGGGGGVFFFFFFWGGGGGGVGGSFFFPCSALLVSGLSLSGMA